MVRPQLEVVTSTPVLDGRAPLPPPRDLPAIPPLRPEEVQSLLSDGKHASAIEAQLLHSNSVPTAHLVNTGHHLCRLVIQLYAIIETLLILITSIHTPLVNRPDILWIIQSFRHQVPNATAPNQPSGSVPAQLPRHQATPGPSNLRRPASPPMQPSPRQPTPGTPYQPTSPPYVPPVSPFVSPNKENHNPNHQQNAEREGRSAAYAINIDDPSRPWHYESGSINNPILCDIYANDDKIKQEDNPNIPPPRRLT